jgi:Kef-type K+ transport system membrane component KefB/Trk K+ transport system NAD-binding subunit
MIEDIILWDLGLIIVAATLLAHIMMVLRQPLIPAYVLAGILIGPLGLQLITNTAVIRTLSELGIAFLLFIVGLELDLRKLRDVGLTATGIGVGSAIIVFAIGGWLAYYMGFSSVEAMYIGLALTFSSTMIVVKILSDKNELETLHGRIILGILLIQDVLAIMAMSILTTFDHLSAITIANSIIWGIGLFSIAIVCSRYIIPTIFKAISKSHELMFLTALSLFFLFAKMSEMSGFSVAIGAFIAGIATATFPYNLEVVGKVRSLRDFFAIVFFVSLGMEISLSNPSALIFGQLVFFVIILVVKPLVMMVLTSLMGYGRRVSFLTGVSLFQVSEFALIMAMQGLIMKHISPEVFSIIASTAVVSITLTSYAIKYDNQIYRLVAERLLVFEKFSSVDKALQQAVVEPDSTHTVVCGSHRMGYAIIKALEKTGKQYIVVDFNPERVKTLIREGIPCIYGDIGDIEVIDKLHLKKADMVISTVVDDEDSMLLISEVKSHNRKTPVIVTAESVKEALELYDYGADYVIVPRMLSGVVVSDIVEGYFKRMHRLENLKDKHVRELLKVEHEETLSKYEFSFVTSIEEKIHGNHNGFGPDNEPRHKR